MANEQIKSPEQVISSLPSVIFWGFITSFLAGVTVYYLLHKEGDNDDEGEY